MGDMADKGREILRANDIINQFLASLDYEIGGELAHNLEGLYRYMLDQMLIANVNNDPAPLAIVVSLLSTLKGGWEEAIATQRKRVAQGKAEMHGILDELVALVTEGNALLSRPKRNRQLCRDGWRSVAAFWKACSTSKTSGPRPIDPPSAASSSRSLPLT